MSYSDKDLNDASKLAYLNFDPADVELHPNWSVKDYFEHDESLARQCRADYGEDFYQSVMNGENPCSSWKVTDYTNKNADSGFVGCCFDTGGGNAVIAFRGSEGVGSKWDWKQIIRDWILSDAGLVNSTETRQQYEARKYIEKIESMYGNDYDSYTLTGHSLGGNLAEHATVMASDSFFSKIDRTLSIDGPGFCDEYLRAHADEIQKHSKAIDRYQCSIVGAILNKLPGVDYKTMLSNGHSHGLLDMQFDESGNMIPSLPDDNAALVAGLTNSIDDMTYGMGIFCLPELIILLLNPVTRSIILGDAAAYAARFAAEAQKGYAEAVRSVDFKIQTDALVSVSDTVNSCANAIQAFCQGVERVRSDLGIVLKLASLFTISIKLRIMENTLNKYAQYAKNMAAKTQECTELYLQYENDIKNMM